MTPVITYEGAAPSAEQVKAAAMFARDVAQLKRAAGLGQSNRSTVLDDGTVVYVVDLQDVVRVHIVVPSAGVASTAVESEVVRLDVSDVVSLRGFLSGVALTGDGDFDTSGRLVVRNDALSLTKGRSRLEPLTADLFSKHESSLKIAVAPADKFGFAEDVSTGNPYTQFMYVAPGLYTGVMSSVVQLLLGCGNVLPVQDEYPARWFERTQQAPTIVSDLTLLDGDAQVISAHPITDFEAFTPAPASKTQIAFDYRWARTHGVLFGSRAPVGGAQGVPLLSFLAADPQRARQPFLVEVGQRGVYAMPLWCDPASFFSETRAEYEKVYPALSKFLVFDGADASLFDALGGFPTGVCLPDAYAELQRWRRAGLVVQADLDLTEFYAGDSFSTGHGWAFADTAASAVNVTIRRRADGFRESECWQLSFTLAQRAGVSVNSNHKSVTSSLALQDFVSQFKACFLTDSQTAQVFSVLRNEGVEAARTFFDDLEVTSLFTIHATASVVAQGLIDTAEHPCPGLDGCTAVGPQWKVWEPLVGGLLSFDFYNLAYVESPEVVDATGPIFATFVADTPEIAYLSLMRTARGGEVVTTNTRQPCQYTGSWEESVVTSEYGLFGAFYTTSVDYREDRIEVSGYRDIVTAKEIGRASYASVDYFFSRSILLSKHVFGRYFRKGQRWRGASLDIALTQACNSRSALFMRVRKTRSDYSKTTAVSASEFWGVTGVSICGSLYNFIVHWYRGACVCNATHTWRECSRSIDVDNCFGVDPPAPFYYSVQGGERPNTFIVTSPATNNAILGSNYYTPVPPQLAATSSVTTPNMEVTQAIYGIGIPEIQAKRLKYEHVVALPDEISSEFAQAWDVCASPPKCNVPGWWVAKNYYGVAWTKLSSDFDAGPHLEFGAEPRLFFPPSGVPFGIVE